ncbi:hypothetical protein ACRRTK_000584 [Alexandromys fortis]
MEKRSSQPQSLRTYPADPEVSRTLTSCPHLPAKGLSPSSYGEGQARSLGHGRCGDAHNPL